MLSRRNVLGAGVATIGFSAIGRATVKSLNVRLATAADKSSIKALLLQDAHIRGKLDKGLWYVPLDADQRIEASLSTIDSPQSGPILHHWIVAEWTGAIVAVTHAVNLPPPPIYDQGGRTAGVILDDSHFGEDSAISSTLLARTEQALLDAGARLTVAASPANWRSRTDFLQSSGYEPTTYFLTKTSLEPTENTEAVRRAIADDIPEIVRISAQHRVQLEIANPQFWRIHPEANARFGAWMAKSVTLTDRAVFVAGSEGRLSGYIIAQPGSPVNLPAPHDISKTGFVDDFWSDGFVSADRVGSGEPAALLAAAEGHFQKRGIRTALIVSPVRLAAKLNFLKSSGYREANLWLVKAAE